MGAGGGQNTSSLPRNLAGPLSQFQDESYREEKGISPGKRAVTTDSITATVVLTSVLEQGHKRA